MEGAGITIADGEFSLRDLWVKSTHGTDLELSAEISVIFVTLLLVSIHM